MSKSKPSDIVLRRLPDGRPSFKGVQHIDIRHSPTGMEWGYGGSGPADLALNVLLAVGVKPAEADRLHQDFKFAYIAPMPHSGGVLKADEILDWVERMRQLAVRKSAECES